MPVDPSIALQVNGGGSGAADPSNSGASALNPMSAVAGYAATAQKLNELKLFNQEFAAKKKFGQIMATADTPEDGLAAASKDPDTAAFVPELIQTNARNQNLLQTYRKTQTDMNTDAFTRMGNLMATAITDPGSVETAFQAQLNQIADPEARKFLAKNGRMVLDSIQDKNPDGSAPTPDQAFNRATALGLSTGSLVALGKTWATPDQIDKGGAIVPGLRSPAFQTIVNSTPGSFTPAGNILYKTLAPQQANTGAPLIGGAYGNGQSQAGSPAGASPTTGIDYSTLAADGKPLFDKSVDMTSPVISRGTGAGGGNVMSADQQTQSHDLSDRFDKEDYNAYQGAVKSIGMLDEMGRNFDELAKIDPGQKGNFLASGAGGELRLNIAKSANAVSAALGGDTVFDPNKIGAGEDLQKVTQRLGPSVLQSLL